MKANFIPLLIVTLFLSLTPVGAATVSVDNTFQFGGSFSLVNPCNGELAQGDISVFIVVTTTQTPDGEVKVNIHHTSHGTLTGNLGNVYQVSRHAKGKFDAISNQYILDWTGNFVGKGAAPNFTADATLRVFTNANNEPIGSQGLNPVVRTCSDD